MDKNSMDKWTFLLVIAIFILAMIGSAVNIITWARTEVLFEKVYKLEDEQTIIKDDIKYQPLVTTLSDAWLRSIGGKAAENVQ